MAETIRTETYNTLLTTTMRNMRGRIRDEISTSLHLCSYLEMRGRKRFVSSGRKIDAAVMYDFNQTGDVYQNYGQLDTTPPEGHTVNSWDWAQMGLTISVSGFERRANQGREAIFNLVQTKKNQAVATAKHMLSSAIVAGKNTTGSLTQFSRVTGIIDPTALGPYPIAALVDANPSRSVALGELNGSTDTWWQNNAAASTATTFAGYKKEMLRQYMNAEKGVGGAPDLCLSDQFTWELYFGSLETKERYMVTDQRTIDTLGGSRDSLIMYRNAVCLWDEHLPDVGTTTAVPAHYFNGNTEVGTYLQSGAHGTMFFLNSDHIEYVCHPQADWVTTPFITPANQPDISTSALIWQGQLLVNSRRKHSVLYDIDNSISS
jgi:hypothetical protein